MSKENYKLRPTDFLLPYIGTKKYMERTECNERSLPKAKVLLIYDAFISTALGFSILFGIEKGLEYILR